MRASWRWHIFYAAIYDTKTKKKLPFPHVPARARHYPLLCLGKIAQRARMTSRRGLSSDVNKKGPRLDWRVFSSYTSGLDLFQFRSGKVRVIKKTAIVPRERDIV